MCCDADRGRADREERSRERASGALRQLRAGQADWDPAHRARRACRDGARSAVATEGWASAREDAALHLQGSAKVCAGMKVLGVREEAWCSALRQSPPFATDRQACRSGQVGASR